MGRPGRLTPTEFRREIKVFDALFDPVAALVHYIRDNVGASGIISESKDAERTPIRQNYAYCGARRAAATPPRSATAPSLTRVKCGGKRRPQGSVHRSIHLRCVLN
ncbi:hypothetical protein EVAR_82901_1 [Eumeta japonica]|uniref:Uncharacterized protein n=1 Tax=Eumeta variegata TaxID=151549 RepID=A0A4C1YFS8_EUMVA|nr:hypothetical protein EVAR_82901_1 [Eumeta japonica]